MKNNGGPAFPVNSYRYDFRDLENHPCKGMSLRDYFAAKAMQGVLANSTFNLLDDDLKTMSSKFYKLADAMLKARGQ